MYCNGPLPLTLLLGVFIPLDLLSNCPLPADRCTALQQLPSYVLVNFSEKEKKNMKHPASSLIVIPLRRMCGITNLDWRNFRDYIN